MPLPADLAWRLLLAAGLGAAAGLGQFALAALTAVLTLVVLAVLPPIEAYFERLAGVTNHHQPPPDAP